MKTKTLKTILALFLFISQSSCQNDDPKLIPTSVELLSDKIIHGITGGYSEPVEILVIDQNGNGLKDIAVNWKLTDGVLIDTDQMTDANGKATAVWKLGHLEKQTLTIKVYDPESHVQISGSPIMIEATADFPDKVTDVDGNEYGTVRIGKQIWLTENLRTTKYSNGTPIDRVEDTEAWDRLTLTAKAYCFYNNSENDDTRYGALYTYAAATNGKGFAVDETKNIQGVCPVGWHIPKYEEWHELQTELDGAFYAGGKMKEAGTDNWLEPNTGATNESGFTALPAGVRTNKGEFLYLGSHAAFWCVIEEWGERKSSSFSLTKDAATFFHGGEIYPDSGFSVRCLMD